MSKKSLEDFAGLCGIAIGLMAAAWAFAAMFHWLPLPQSLLWWTFPWIITVVVLTIGVWFFTFAAVFGLIEYAGDMS